MSGRALIVDDEAELTALLARGLERRGFAVTTATSGEAALARLATDDVDVVVTDLNLGGMSGLALTERILASRPGLPVIVLTAFGSLEAAVGAIRVGAYDFLAKPVEVEALALTVGRAVRHRQLTDELVRLRRQVATGRGGELVGESAAMREVFDLIDRVAPTDASVLITGESGTGKELVARALHRQSARAAGPLIAINCAAMPEQLLESELFGHVKGAFTDARASRAGLFVQASGGTLFLDEIGELPLALQAKLLRALQERTVRPLGGDAEVAFDVRVVAATNRDLEAAVEARAFRDDLYYRIDVVHLPLPPLRARGGDVLVLAQRFLADTARRFGKPVTALAPAAAERLAAYGWPGNVRELANAIERAVALARFDQLTVDDLPERIRAATPSALVVAGADPSELVSLEEVERRYVLHVLQAAGGSRTVASRILGLDRKTLYRKLKGYGVDDG
ncbi:MAG: sigma-54-dependent Fis family transcriptional regulator [Myxococcales bacterium]|nr:sigma-54-dependent Fis family transcriptional regulator [Myxococcales bacterium]